MTSRLGRLALPAALLGALTLAACTPSSPAKEASSPSSPPVRVASIPRTVDVRSISGIVSDQQSGTLSAKDGNRAKDVSWNTTMIALPGHPAFNRALADRGADLVIAHVDHDPNTHMFRLDWSVPVAEGEVFAVRLRSQKTHEANETPAVSTQTLYTRASSDETVPSMALIDAKQQAKAAKAVCDAAAANGTIPNSGQVDPAAALQDIVLNADGTASVILTPDALGAGVSEPVGVHVDKDTLATWLSPTGRAYLSALASTPTPSITAHTKETPHKRHAAVLSFAGLPNDEPAPYVTATMPRSHAPIDCAATKCIALTYDDGPGKPTARLLDILKQYDVDATFFLVGRSLNGGADLVRREVAEGNEVGIHTWNHPDLSKASVETITREIADTGAAIEKITGVNPPIVRPPYGAINSTVLATLGTLGKASIHWNVDTEDWKNQNADTVYERAMAAAKPGAIILMHDVHPYGPDATERIIVDLKRQGYTFVTIAQMYGERLKPGAAHFSFNNIR
ncbi:MAG: polysaccharide deacetylase family protein [Actinomycetaceae bacterium]|nr:polysaccharide deacetylase family protein [Actinomycetaceae bacterium]